MRSRLLYDKYASAQSHYYQHHQDDALSQYPTDMVDPAIINGQHQTGGNGYATFLTFIPNPSDAVYSPSIDDQTQTLNYGNSLTIHSPPLDVCDTTRHLSSIQTAISHDIRTLPHSTIILSIPTIHQGNL